MGRKRLLVAALAAGLIASACTGAPRPENLAAGKAGTGSGLEGGGTGGATDGNAELTTDTTAAPTLDAAGRPTNAAAQRATKNAPKPGTPGVVPGITPGVAGADGIVPLDLFTPQQDKIGITDKTIKICGHAALTFAQAFDTRPEDINVYWEDVANRGGIHGRNVEVSIEDDAYDPQRAVSAADACKAKNPFFILGGIGFDQIPAVQKWADDNKQLYIHHIAVGAGSENKRYSFTPQPTVEQVGTAMGEYIANKYKGPKVGSVYRNSENWKPGFDNAIAYMKKAGVNLGQSLPVEKNQSVYSQQILALKGNAEVVFLWENALAAAEFIEQAHQQSYFPTFIVFPFQTTLDVVGQDSLRSKIDGVSTWPAYKRGGYEAKYAFPGTGYNEEIQRFEAAMAKYRPGVKPNDILWQVWIANKGIEDLFQRCGRDCTRNRFAGVLAASKGAVAPNCPVDYPRGGGRKGGWQAFMTQEAYDAGGSAAFRTTRWCSEHLN